MIGKALLLVCLAVLFSAAPSSDLYLHQPPLAVNSNFVVTAADAGDRSKLYRRPSCGDMSVTQACPLNYSPVCGNDGHTYPNECALCVHRLETNADVLIVKEGSC